MRFDALQELLDAHQVPYRDRGTNVGREHLNICCPFCAEVRYHCGIHIQDLWFKCFVCGEGGQWGKLRRQLEVTFPHVPWSELTSDRKAVYMDTQSANKVLSLKIDLPTHYLRKFRTSGDEELKKWMLQKPADLKHKYRSRGLDHLALRALDVRVGKNRLDGYVGFVEGRNFVARKWKEGVAGPRWYKRIQDRNFLFGASVVAKTERSIGVITEGVFDMLRFPVGSAVAVLGQAVGDGMLAEIVKVFRGTETIALALDRDCNAGALANLDLSLRDLGFQVRKFDWKEIYDVTVKDADEVFLRYGKDRLYSSAGFTEEPDHKLL